MTTFITSFLGSLLLVVVISLLAMFLVRPVMFLRLVFHLFFFWPDIVGRMRTPNDRRVYHPTFAWEFAQGAWWAVLLVAIVVFLIARLT